MRVPRYDKSAFSGAGDTADSSTWPSVVGPVDIVLFEGWMLGFNALGPSKASVVAPSLGVVDTFLAEYKAAWDAHVHSWLVVQVEDAQCVFQWRLQAEKQMKQAGKDGMSDEEVRDFVSRYMPAYQAYLPALYSTGPTTSRPGHLLRVGVDKNRCLQSAHKS
jgi:D-glycerate 3-kinase